MFTLEYDDSLLGLRFSNYEKTILPSVLEASLNEAMFHVRDGFRSEFASVFDRPTAITLGAILFKKATKDNLVAVVFVRDKSNGGTPPAKYLLPEAAGGPRAIKPFERKLNVISGAQAAFYTPGRSLPLNQYGNVPPSAISSILKQVGGTEKATTAHRRARRQAKKGGGGTYFVLKQNRGKLKAGVVYERIESAHGSAVRTVLFPVKQPVYPVRFNVGATAQRLFNESFPAAFKRWFDTFKVRT